MNTPMLWFLLANVGFAVLWVYYRIFLHRDTFFKGKRLTLLLGLIFSLIYPLLNIAAWMPILHPVQQLTQSIIVALPEITVTANGNKAYSTIEIFTILYFSIMGLLVLRVVFQFAKLILLSHRYGTLEVDGQKIICLPKGSAPFSFFGLVFIQPEDHSESDLKEILHHEQTHVRQAHTLDVLLAELICTVFWINPFAWLLKYDLRENLEFLADKDVVHAGFDPKSYQYHLLRLSYQQSPIRMGNNFNVSQLQNRIKMMNKKRTSHAGWSKYLLTLPLFAFLLMVSYGFKIKPSTDVNVQNKVVAVASADKVVTPSPPPLKLTGKLTAHTQNVSKKETSLELTEAVVPEKISAIKITTPVNTQESDTAVYIVEQMPQFPGGIEELMKFIKDNLHYPHDAFKAGIEGRVVIRFIVSRNGDVTDVTVIRGIDSSCDNEAVRVVKMMPKWIPGRKNGQNVAVFFTLPISYKLKK